MFDDPSFDIWQAFRSRILSNPDLATINAVWSVIPPNVIDLQETYPFVSLGPSDAISDNGINFSGHESTLQLDLWVWEAGIVQSSTLRAALIKEFDHQPLALTSHSVAGVGLDYVQTLQDPSRPDVMHTAIRFKIITEQR
jgi:hypothetical protein